MTKRVWQCACLFIVWASLLTACGEGFIATGTSEKSHFAGKNGWLERSIKKANGSAVQKIELERPGRRLYTNVTLEVGEGTFQIELMDGEGNVTLTLEATSGQPASDSSLVTTGPFGDVKYRVTAVEAKDVKYRIEFDIK
jgi:hypothetical protein